MRVLIDALSVQYGGSETYACSQLEALARARPDWTLTVLAEPRNETTFRRIPGVDVLVANVPWRLTRLMYEQMVLPFAARHRADVLYCLGNFIPLVSGVPTVVVQQSARLFGRWPRVSPVMRLHVNGIQLQVEAALARASVRRADGVVVISRALLAEMEKDGFTSDRCTVVQSGSPEAMPSPVPVRALEGVDRFFVSVGADYPHKRLDDVVRAWGTLMEDESSSLVIAGTIAPRRVEFQRSLVRPERRTRMFHLGHVGDRAQLRWLLENALALVSASELEAFPLTPGEAGAVGCPLILSDIPAHIEASEGRSAYFRPGDAGSLAATLDAVLIHPPDRAPWAWPVTWDMNAEQVAAVLERVYRP